MKYLLLCCLSFVLIQNAEAQTLEINPEVQWKYIRAQTLDLAPDNTYKYEIPMEKGFDYVFNLFYKESNLVTYIKVYDMQMKPIANVTDAKSIKSTKLAYTVESSGTYIVLVGFANKSQVDANETVPIEITLIRRETVE